MSSHFALAVCVAYPSLFAQCRFCWRLCDWATFFFCLGVYFLSAPKRKNLARLALLRFSGATLFFHPNLSFVPPQCFESLFCCPSHHGDFFSVFSSAPVFLLNRPGVEEKTFSIFVFSLPPPMLIIQAHARIVVGHFIARPSHN